MNGIGEIRSLLTLLRRLWAHISVQRRIQMAGLVVLIVISGFCEIVSIGLLVPYLSILSDAQSLDLHPIFKAISGRFGYDIHQNILLPLTIIFGFAVILAGSMRLLLLWVSSRLSFEMGSDLSNLIYLKALYQPYSVHISRNSSEIISGISSKADTVIYYVIIPVINLISSFLMLFFIMSALIYINPMAAFVSFIGFGIIYIAIIFLSRKRLQRNSKSIAVESVNAIKSLQEGLGGIRDVLLDSSQSIYSADYKKSEYKLRMAQGDNLFIAQGPRFIVEALGLVLLLVLAYFLGMQDGGISVAIPVLGALALGAQRLLPMLQQSYAAWSNIQAGQSSLIDTILLLEQPLPRWMDTEAPSPIKFENEICLSNLKFQYSNESKYILNGLNLTINKGSIVGFVGKTGCGKSTLLDIIMGLLDPTSGELLIDGIRITESNKRAWQELIAHVPQAIYLADSTIEENIALGTPRESIDKKLVIESARKAQILDVIEGFPGKYQTFVGERGIRLSGGQRQRIGIARALYKKAKVIILDEATSALDEDTEQMVMKSFENSDRDVTLLIIAHRLATLNNCDQIIDFDSLNMSGI